MAASVSDAGLLGVAGQPVPSLRVDRANGLGDPAHLEPVGSGDGHGHDAEHSFGVGLGVCEGKSRAPGDAVDQPPVSREMLTKPLEIIDQVGRCVLAEVIALCGDVRHGPATAALVQADDAKPRRIEPFPVAPCADSASGAAVQVHGGDAAGIPRLLPVDLVAITDRQQPGRPYLCLIEHGARQYRDSKIPGAVTLVPAGLPLGQTWQQTTAAAPLTFHLATTDTE